MALKCCFSVLRILSFSKFHIRYAVADLFGVNQLELHVSPRPDDQVCIGGVVQECEQELPQLQGATALVRQTLLFHFTW